ncbi:MAG: LLM class flavin-dependent oxidoreductase, partial [Halobacteriales archaeon]|nr:LLM class flavin-dependent oxidoreductase [Halobacteriales archaeon]
MQYGLFLNAQAPSDDDPGSLVDGLIAQTQAARDAGFDLISIGQHYVADYVQLQLMPLLGRLAPEAGDMTLSTGILLQPLHHPVEIAEQFTTLRALGNEVIVGVGAGYRDAEFEAFGIPKRERAGRLHEAVELMNRLWTEESVTYDGQFYQVEDVTICPRPPEKPPVWIAGNARPAVRRAAQIGDAWFAPPHSTVAEVAEFKAEYDTVRKERGADTGLAIFREAFVADSREAALATAGDYLEDKYQRYLEWGQGESMESGAELDRPFADLAEDRFLFGTPEDVAAEAERDEEDLDVSHLVLRVQW